MENTTANTTPASFNARSAEPSKDKVGEDHGLPKAHHEQKKKFKSSKTLFPAFVKGSN
jgi:hypothetical protein